MRYCAPISRRTPWCNPGAGRHRWPRRPLKATAGILSAGYYLDHLRPASYHYGIDPLAGAAQKLTPELASRILEARACMWAEYANAETVDSRIWPRAAVIAERLWSPKEAAADGTSMYATHGSRQPRAGVDRRAAPCQLRPHAGAASPPAARPNRCGF